MARSAAARAPDTPSPWSAPATLPWLGAARAMAALLAAGLGLAGCAAETGGPAETAEAADSAARAGHEPDGTPAAPGEVTFSRHVAPILYRNCVPCHRPGQVAPFSLLRFEDAARRARLIATVTESRYMPPWKPEPGYGRFLDERRLGDEEIALLRAWAEAGAPEGERDALPPPPAFAEGWQLGAPDLVVSLLRLYDLPAEGADVFRNFVLPLELPEDVYVHAVELRPEPARVLHHATILADATGAARQLDAEEPEVGFAGMVWASGIAPPAGHLIGWAPGQLPRPFRDGTQWPLRRGTDLVLETHMLPTGRPERVGFRVGLYFTGEPPTRRPVVVRLGSEALDIPAGEAAYRVRDDFVVPIDVEAVMVFPHAHYLAREVRGWAELPDGSRQELIRIRDWDFNWQGSYHFAEPLTLPAGTRLRAELVFDNSADNSMNPHQPPRRVLWGPRSSDEMADLWVQLLPRRERERFRLDREAARHRAQIVRQAQEARLRRDPGDADAQMLLGDALLELGKPAEAIGHYRESLRLRPGSSAVENQLAGALLTAGRVDEALRLYEGVLEREPGNHQVRVNLAMAMAVTGRLEAAEAQLRRALEHGPGSIEAHLNLGAVLNDLGRPAEARRHLERAVAGRPESATAHFNLANALRGLGEPGAAERHYLESLRLDPAYPPAYNNLGVLLGGQGRLEEAAELFRRALALDPENADARANLAALERAGRDG